MKLSDVLLILTVLLSSAAMQLHALILIIRLTVQEECAQWTVGQEQWTADREAALVRISNVLLNLKRMLK